jgi:hypothetical protein
LTSYESGTHPNAYILIHGQATDMDMKAFEDFWKIFAIGNFKKP